MEDLEEEAVDWGALFADNCHPLRTLVTRRRQLARRVSLLASHPWLP